MNSVNAYTFADGTIGCDNATFSINNTDKSLELGFNYKSVILNKMAPFIILTNGNKYYIKDLLPEYSNRLNFSINQLSCGNWKFGLNLSIPQAVDVDYIGFSYENVIGNPNIELDRENHQVRIGNGNADLIIDWSDVTDRVSLNKTSKEVLINITGIKNISIDPTVVFSTASITSVHTAPLGTNRFVLAYCDDTNNVISFKIYDTNETVIIDETDVDTTAGGCDYTSVGASAFNSTHFVIGWFDFIDKDATFAVYDSSGTLVDGPTDADTDVGSHRSVSVSTFNSTHFVIGWYDETDLDATFAVYDSSGTLVSGPTDVDDDVSSSYSVSVSTFNSTHFVISWYDYTDTDATFAVYTSSGTLVSGPTDADDDVSTSYSVQVSTFNSTHFVIGWFDRIDLDATFAVYDSSGTLVSGPTDADDDVSTSSYSVKVSTFNSTHFVISWYDYTDYDLSYAIYTSSGASVVGITDIESWPTASNAPFTYQSPTSQEVSSGLAICNNNWVIAYGNTTTQGVWRSYMANGSDWNGICPAVNNPPTYSLNSTSVSSPATYSTTQNYGFEVNWTDDSDSNGYNTSLIEHNFTGTLTNYTTTRSGNTSYYNFTSIPVGSYVFKFYANDSDNAWNSTDQWTYTINQVPTNISLYLNGTEANQTLTYRDISNITATINTTAIDVDVYMNDTLINTNTSKAENVTDINWFKNATYKITANHSDSQNYTLTSRTYYIFVNKANNPCHINITYNSINYEDQDVSITGGDSITVQGFLNNSAISNLNRGTAVLYYDSTAISNPTSHIPTYGTHTYLVNTSGNENYTSNATGITVTVTVATTGGGGVTTGGGGGPAPQVIYAGLGEYCSEEVGNETLCAEGLTCKDNTCISEALGPICGDNVCDIGESFITCSSDCPTESLWATKTFLVIIAGTGVYVLVWSPKLARDRKNERKKEIERRKLLRR